MALTTVRANVLLELFSLRHESGGGGGGEVDVQLLVSGASVVDCVAVGVKAAGIRWSPAITATQYS
eukprot:SAG25_NODE_191_length_12265_cov_16.310538_20_plen_66_part_00